MDTESEQGYGTRKESGMPETDWPGRMSRASFLKLGLAGLSTTAMAFAAACGGEEEDDDDEEDDD